MEQHQPAMLFLPQAGVDHAGVLPQCSTFPWIITNDGNTGFTPAMTLRSLTLKAPASSRKERHGILDYNWWRSKQANARFTQASSRTTHRSRSTRALQRLTFSHCLQQQPLWISLRLSTSLYSHTPSAQTPTSFLPWSPLSKSYWANRCCKKYHAQLCIIIVLYPSSMPPILTTSSTRR